MQRSVYFRRILILLVLALFLWTLLTALLYGMLSKPVFTRIKVDELKPKAQAMATIAAASFMQQDPYFDSILSSSFEFFDAWVFVVDGLSRDIRNTSLPEDAGQLEPEINAQIEQNLDSILSGESSSIWFTRRMRGGSREMLFIGVPVSLRFGRQSGVVGAVFFVKPLEELSIGLRNMNIALLTSSLIVFLLMMIPAYIATAKLIQPLRQTRDVALAMAEGDFSVRADTKQKGEIGELASTMNNLAQQLSGSISALTFERNRLRQVLEGMGEGLIAVDADLNLTQINQAALSLLGFTDSNGISQSANENTGQSAYPGSEQSGLDQSERPDLDQPDAGPRPQQPTENSPEESKASGSGAADSLYSDTHSSDRGGLHWQKAKRQPVAGQPLSQLIGHDNPFKESSKLYKTFMEAIESKKSIKTTMACTNERKIQLHVSCLQDNRGKIVGAVGLLRDITESERLEQTRRDYVANVSHELRTPLTAIRALLEPLNDGMVSNEDDRRRYYNILLRETARLSHLINDMLELSRLQAKSLPIHMRKVNMQDMLSDLKLKYQTQAEDLSLTLRLPDHLPDCPDAYGDQERIEQILVILIDNAMKFTPDHGEINIRLAWDEKSIYVTVADTGIGISPEDLDHVFDRFYKADKAHQQPGTGLGLSIAREILHLMDQNISVESKPGEGTAFTFTLSRYDNQNVDTF